MTQASFARANCRVTFLGCDQPRSKKVAVIDTGADGGEVRTARGSALQLIRSRLVKSGSAMGVRLANGAAGAGIARAVAIASPVANRDIDATSRSKSAPMKPVAT